MAKKIIDEFVARLGYEYDPKGLKKFTEGSKQVLMATKNIAIATVAGASAALAAVTGFNALTASQEKQAKAIGFSGQAFREWIGLAQEAGFEGEVLTDLVEEMNNKIGESKGLGDVITPVKESLQILKLEFAAIKDLAPEEMFNTIADAIVRLDDKQAAVSAADILMGGEANKFFALLRARKQSVDDALADQRELILLTDEEAQASLQWGKQVGALKKVIVSAFQVISAMFAMSIGDVGDLRKRFTTFFNENREEIREWVENFAIFVKKLYVTTVGIINLLKPVFIVVFGLIFQLVKALDWLNNSMTKVWDRLSKLFGKNGILSSIKEMFSFGNIKADIVPSVVTTGQAAGATTKSSTVNNSIAQENNLNISTNNPTAAGQSVDRALKTWTEQSTLNLASGVI